MKVKEFIDGLMSKYSPEDELYFTVGAAESEHTFDKVEIYPKDNFSDETGVYLSFNDENRRDFESSILFEYTQELREDLENVLAKHLK